VYLQFLGTKILHAIPVNVCNIGERQGSTLCAMKSIDVTSSRTLGILKDFLLMQFHIYVFANHHSAEL
jgi:hypothetical protein